MDHETASLFDVLRQPGASLLLELLAGPMSEDALVQAVSSHDQSRINRKLHQLADKQLIVREPGKRQQKHLKWELPFPDETGEFLAAGVRLAELGAQRRVDLVSGTASRLRAIRKSDPG